MSNEHVHGMTSVPQLSFLACPGEIRQIIYRYALVPVGEVCLCRKIDREDDISQVEPDMRCKVTIDAHAPYHERPSVHLLATCRQIYDEAKDIVFDQNRFILTLRRGAKHHQTPKTAGMDSPPYKDRSVDVLDAPRYCLAEAQKVAIIASADYLLGGGPLPSICSELPSARLLSITVLTKRATEIWFSLPMITRKASMHRHLVKAIFEGAPKACGVSFDSNSQAEKSCIAMMRMPEVQRNKDGESSFAQVSPEVLSLYVQDLVQERSMVKDNSH